MLHDVFVDNVSKEHDEHGFHCTHMRWNCIQDDLNHAWFREGDRFVISSDSF